MYCPSCGVYNDAGTEKCTNCGKPLPKLSPTGEPLPVENPSRPADWPPQPQPNSNPGPGGYYQPGQPGSQYSYAPPPPNYGLPYSQYQPLYTYTTPADRVGVAGAEGSFLPRLGAYLIDSLLVGILVSIVTVVPMVIWAINFVSKYQSQLIPVCDSSSVGYSRSSCNTVIQRVLIDQGELGGVIGLALGLLVLGVLIYVLYYALQTARGTTVGKRVFGLKVVTADGSAPGFGRALLRHTIGYFISGIFWLGFIWIIFDPQRQGWHDKIAGTYVVRA